MGGISFDASSALQISNSLELKAAAAAEEEEEERTGGEEAADTAR